MKDKTLDMKVVIHCGEDSPRYIRDFQELRAEHIGRKLRSCTADECAYRYFLERDGNLFGEASDYDGQHGISVYNKTDQLKAEDEDPTFFKPKFSQMSKVIRDGFVLMGEHSYVYGIY